MTIFDLMTSEQLVAYWDALVADEAPYPCEELFPDTKKMGLTLKWLKGAKGLPVVLKASAFDAHAIPRTRIGFEKLSAEMPYFKESTYIDEELRQELNIVLQTGVQAYIDSIMTKIFDDETSLLRGARATRERMRMMALTSGVVSMTSNGQLYTYDYGVTHKSEVSVSWSDTENADPIEDIRVAKETIEDETGTIIARAMCDGKTWRYLRNNKKIKEDIYVMSNGTRGAITDEMLSQYIETQLDGLKVAVNRKKYKDEDGAVTPFMPTDTFVLLPDGTLGETAFGTTPAESDLMASAVANVAITDTGVAVTTVEKADPVNVETIVSMICLPSFEGADHVYILDVKKG